MRRLLSGIWTFFSFYCSIPQGRAGKNGGFRQNCAGTAGKNAAEKADARAAAAAERAPVSPVRPHRAVSLPTVPVIPRRRLWCPSARRPSTTARTFLCLEKSNCKQKTPDGTSVGRFFIIYSTLGVSCSAVEANQMSTVPSIFLPEFVQNPMRFSPAQGSWL